MRSNIIAGCAIGIAAALMVAIAVAQQRTTGSPGAMGVAPDSSLNGPAPVVELGAAAPDFRLNDQNGRGVQLYAVSKDAWALVAFFPKASSPG